MSSVTRPPSFSEDALGGPERPGERGLDELDAGSPSSGPSRPAGAPGVGRRCRRPCRRRCRRARRTARATSRRPYPARDRTPRAGRPRRGPRRRHGRRAPSSRRARRRRQRGPGRRGPRRRTATPRSRARPRPSPRTRGRAGPPRSSSRPCARGARRRGRRNRRHAGGRTTRRARGRGPGRATRGPRCAPPCATRTAAGRVIGDAGPDQAGLEGLVLQRPERLEAADRAIRAGGHRHRRPGEEVVLGAGSRGHDGVAARSGASVAARKRRGRRAGRASSALRTISPPIAVGARGDERELLGQPVGRDDRVGVRRGDQAVGVAGREQARARAVHAVAPRRADAGRGRIDDATGTSSRSAAAGRPRACRRCSGRGRPRRRTPRA